MWRSISGGEVADIVEEIRGLVAEGERRIHIGTDSQPHGRHTDFVTVIAVLNPGKGGRVFYRRERTARARSLAHKLFREAELSIAVAQALSASIDEEILVHVDANEDPRHRSSNYVQALAGMVVGHGFEVQLKPHSWCASHVADHVVKERLREAA